MPVYVSKNKNKWCTQRSSTLIGKTLGATKNLVEDYQTFGTTNKKLGALLYPSLKPRLHIRALSCLTDLAQKTPRTHVDLQNYCETSE